MASGRLSHTKKLGNEPSSAKDESHTRVRRKEGRWYTSALVARRAERSPSFPPSLPPRVAHSRHALCTLPLLSGIEERSTRPLPNSHLGPHTSQQHSPASVRSPGVGAGRTDRARQPALATTKTRQGTPVRRRARRLAHRTRKRERTTRTLSSHSAQLRRDSMRHRPRSSCTLSAGRCWSNLSFATCVRRWPRRPWRRVSMRERSCGRPRPPLQDHKAPRSKRMRRRSSSRIS